MESEKNSLLETQNELFSMFKRISCVERASIVWKMESDFTQFGNARRIRFLFWFRGSRTLCTKILRKRERSKNERSCLEKGGPSASILIKLRKVQMDRPSPHENRKKDPESFDTLQLRVEFCFL